MLPLFSKISSRCTLLPRLSLASGLWRRQEPLDRTAGEQYRITKLFPSQKSGGAFERFINEDKAHFESGYNFYRYLRNSPTRFIDPFGLADVNPQDMASLQGLFPSFTPLSNTEVVVPDALRSGKENTRTEQLLLKRQLAKHFHSRAAVWRAGHPREPLSLLGSNCPQRRRKR
jgi:hypothetical protein